MVLQKDGVDHLDRSCKMEQFYIESRRKENPTCDKKKKG